jgi:Cof subfamily protein (haloacid dehalogenase superfamily)
MIRIDCSFLGISYNSPMQIRLLVLDIDGTLLNPSGQLTEPTIAAVRASVAAGCIVTLATGRRFRTAKPIADALGLELPILVQNGALIKDSLTGEVLYHRHLACVGATLAVEYLWNAGEQPIVYENAFLGEGVYTGPVERDGPINGPYFARNGDYRRCPTLRELLPSQSPLEVSAVNDAARLTAIAPGLVHPGFRIITTTYTSGAGFLEVLDAQCSKAEALHELARRFDVPMAQTMAIGDNLNDLELLAAAGVGVAMGNARPEVQAIARYVTASNAEDGVAQAITRHVTGPRLATVPGILSPD